MAPRKVSEVAHTRRRFLAALSGLSLLPAAGCARRLREGWGVAVVGSGPAGALLACRLVEQGIPTVLLEGGPETPGTALPPAGGYPITTTRFQGPGGTSNLWAGGCARLMPRDFAFDNPYAPGAWPLAYADVAPYYDVAERELMVCGGATTRYSPPRSHPYERTRADAPVLQALVDRLAAGGVVAELPPLSSRPGEAGIRVAHTHLPRFLSSPLATWLEGHRVTGLRVARGGQVGGLEVRSGGETATIRADAYVLACGGIETPRLLLLAHSPQAPRGIGNDADLVGRAFSEHLAVDLGSVRPATAGADAEVLSFQLYDEFKDLGLGGVVLEATVGPPDTLRLAAIVEMKPHASNRVTLDARRRDAGGRPEAAVSIELSDDEHRTLARLRNSGAAILGRFGAARPAELRYPSWCHHHMGACRMGADPRGSVVDATLRVHGWRNLYVAGSAPFVTAGVGSPTLLIAALTLRLAEHLGGELGGRRPARPAA